MRLGAAPTHGLDDRFDLLLAIDWQNVHRFADEIPLAATSVMIGDPDEGEAPEVFRSTGARYFPRPLQEDGQGIPGSWTEHGRAGPGRRARRDSRGRAGRASCATPGSARPRRSRRISPPCTRGWPPRRASTACRGLRAAAKARGRRWLISGNEAAGYGAIRGGVRFVAAYPITPATELLEWMAPALAKIGGTLLQAEDELASINMIIGASYGGVPSLTATAGPGLALMAEGIGLAVGAEVPIVVVDVMRGGPSTGIPAKSEQSDLSFAVAGLHGDAPRLVLAPTSIADCLATTQWAVELAEAMQAPAIVLSDQFMGQSRAIIDRPADVAFLGRRLTAAANAPRLQALPQHRVRHFADGDSRHARHRVHGRRPRAHRGRHPQQPVARPPPQLDKRERKLAQHDYGRCWADIEGDGEAAVITFGSTTAAVREAIARAAAAGVRSAADRDAAARAGAAGPARRGVGGRRPVLVIEQNHGAQLFRYLRSMYDLPGKPASFHRAGPLPLRPGERRINRGPIRRIGASP